MNEQTKKRKYAGYTCINCHANPALKDNGGLCESCGKGQRNPVFRGGFAVNG